MSAASSVSAASAAAAAAESPVQAKPLRAKVAAARIIEPKHTHSRTASRTSSGFSDRPVAPNPALSTPATPAPSAPATPAHKLARSVGNYAVSPGVEARRAGLESPSRAKVVEPNLPSAPSAWTPSELAQYLSWALRSGGTDGHGPTLPSPVVEDVVSWVLRSQVTGRQFVTGVDQGVTRPPPFLPVLAVMSRRLRRAGSRLSDVSISTASSISVDDDGEKEVTRVRRLAHAFEHSASEPSVSGDDTPLSVLREQLTGDSVHGFGRATPKTEPRNWSRRDSVASIASITSGISVGSNARWRPSEAGDSSVSVWVSHLDEEAYVRSNASPTAPLRAKAEAKAALELAELADIGGKNDGSQSDSPPPPYAPSPRALFTPADSVAASLSGCAESGCPTPLPPSTSPSPEPEDAEPDSPSPSTHSTHMAHMARMGALRAAGAEPYAVLRLEGKAGRPSMLFTQPEGAAPAKPAGPHSHAQRSTGRRASSRSRALSSGTGTLTSSPSTPCKNAGKNSAPSTLRRRREAAMAREVAALTERIRELETRLAVVEDEAPGSLPGSVLRSEAVRNEVRNEVMAAADAAAAAVEAEQQEEGEEADPDAEEITPLRVRRGLLAALGLADEFGNEPRLQDLPALLFLLGVGVGAGGCAVVVRILLQRKITV